jgi:ubiquinone/menaquinone biosynthesis C-methylase UbiE
MSALVLAGAAMPAARAQSPATHEHHFKGAEHWAQVFDDPQRDEWQKPHEVIQALHLAPGAKVADIGAGTGYFSVRLAHFVPAGHVYAVDIEPDMVAYLTERAKREGIKNMTAVTGEAGSARLPEKVDVVLMVDTYHHIGDPEAYFRGLRTSLAPAARVAIIDFRKSSPMGPPVGERVAPDQVEASMRKAGYKLVNSNDFLANQYYLVFQVGDG